MHDARESDESGLDRMFVINLACKNSHHCQVGNDSFDIISIIH